MSLNNYAIWLNCWIGDRNSTDTKITMKLLTDKSLLNYDELPFQTAPLSNEGSQGPITHSFNDYIHLFQRLNNANEVVIELHKFRGYLKKEHVKRKHFLSSIFRGKFVQYFLNCILKLVISISWFPQSK